jgi:hypothetical protein
VDRLSGHAAFSVRSAGTDLWIHVAVDMWTTLDQRKYPPRPVRKKKLAIRIELVMAGGFPHWNLLFGPVDQPGVLSLN